MRITVIIATLVTPVLVVSLCAAPQSQGSKPNLEQQLKAEYRTTRVGTNGVVLQVGSVMVVQQDNIRANSADNQIYWPNTYKRDGRVKQPTIIVKNGAAAAKSSLRLLQVGERVYVTLIEIKPSDIVFSLQSCGTCDPSAPDPNAPPYRAELSFQFQKGFAESATFQEIRDMIGQVLAIASASAPAQALEKGNSVNSTTQPRTEPKAQVTDAPFQPIEPPPPPADQPPPTQTISKGDTKDQVVEILGLPQRVVKAGTKEIFYFKDVKVTFVNGKVSDVE